MAHRFPVTFNFAWLKNIFVFGDGNSVSVNVGQGSMGPVVAWLWKFLAPADEVAQFPGDYFSPGLRDNLMNKHLDACFNNESRTAALIGKAGVGKTTAMQGIMDRLEKSDRNVIVAAMFFIYSLPEWHKPEKVLMRILAQFIVKYKYPRLVSRVAQLYEDSVDETDQCPPLKKTAAILTSVLQELQRDQCSACIIIDAVDECKRYLEETLKRLRDIQKETRVGIIITDRLTEDGLWMDLFPNAHSIKLASAEKSDIRLSDIRLYIRQRLMRSGLKLFERSPSLLESVSEHIMDASAASFLFAKLNVEDLITREPTNETSLRQDLSSIQNRSAKEVSKMRGEASGKKGKEQVKDVHETFATKYLDRIAPMNDRTHDGQLAGRVLRFVRDAERPFSVPELICAIAWDTENEQRDQGRCRNWSQIQRICLGLVDTDDPSSDSPVRLYHPGFKALLDGDEMKRRLPDSNEELGTICVQYLNQKSLNTGACSDKTKLEDRIKTHPLLRYAATNWKAHFKRCDFTSRDTETVSRRGLFHEATQRFLEADANVQCAVQLATQNDPVFVGWFRALQNFAAMTFEEIHHMRTDRLDDDIFAKLSYRFEETKDFGLLVAYRTTGLHLASWHGFDTLVESLLKAGKAFECRDRGDQTPLHVASAAGHHRIVQLLLKHDADPDVRDIFGFSPLLAAAQRGSEVIVKMFLDHRLAAVDVNAQTTSRCSVPRQTAVHIAVQEGHFKVVQALVHSPRIDVNVQDARGETAFHLAARIGKYDMIKELFRSEKVDLDLCVLATTQESATFGQSGSNALHLACTNKVEANIIRYLLKISPGYAERPDSSGKLPIHCAVEAEAIDIVQILLDETEVGINIVDLEGHSPAFKAIKTRNADICELFFELPNVDWTIRANGLTMWDYARRCGNEQIRKKLLRFISPTPSAPTSSEQSPDQSQEISPVGRPKKPFIALESPPVVRAVSAQTVSSSTTLNPDITTQSSFDTRISRSPAGANESRSESPETPRSVSRTMSSTASQKVPLRPTSERSGSSQTALSARQKNMENTSAPLTQTLSTSGNRPPALSLPTPTSTKGKAPQKDEPQTPGTPTLQGAAPRPRLVPEEDDKTKHKIPRKQPVNKKEDSRPVKKSGQGSKGPGK